MDTELNKYEGGDKKMNKEIVQRLEDENVRTVVEYIKSLEPQIIKKNVVTYYILDKVVIIHYHDEIPGYTFGVIERIHYEYFLQYANNNGLNFFRVPKGGGSKEYRLILSFDMKENNADVVGRGEEYISALKNAGFIKLDLYDQIDHRYHLNLVNLTVPLSGFQPTIRSCKRSENQANKWYCKRAYLPKYKNAKFYNPQDSTGYETEAIALFKRYKKLKEDNGKFQHNHLTDYRFYEYQFVATFLGKYTYHQLEFFILSQIAANPLCLYRNGLLDRAKELEVEIPFYTEEHQGFVVNEQGQKFRDVFGSSMRYTIIENA